MQFCSWKLLPFCLFIVARFQVATTKFSKLPKDGAPREQPLFFWRSWRSHWHVFTTGMIRVSQTPPRSLWKPSWWKEAGGVPIDEANWSAYVSRRWVTSEEHMCQDRRSTPSTLLAFQAKGTNQLLKIHPHFPQVKATASSKSPWKKGINQTTLQKWGLPVGLQLLGDAANRAQTLGCARNWGGGIPLLHEIPGINLERAAGRSGNPSPHLKSIQLPSQIPCQVMGRTVTSSSLSCQLHIQ